MTSALQNSGLFIAAPQDTAIRNAALNGARQHAQRIRDWSALDAAVDAQMAEQAAFVAWWDGTVGKNWGGARSKVADLRLCSAEDAEEATNISKQQVSRWRKRMHLFAGEQIIHGHTTAKPLHQTGLLPTGCAIRQKAL